MGSGITSIALGLLAFNLVGASVSEVVGVVLTIRILSRVFLAPWAGAIAARLGTRATMMLGDLISAAAVLGFFLAQTVAQLYVLATVLSVANAFFTPLYKATIPRVVTPEQYPRALAYGSMAYDVANIAGPAVAGLVVSLVGLRGNFLLDASTFLASAAIVWWLPRACFPPHKPGEASARAALSGIRAVLARPMLREAGLLSWHQGIIGGFILVATVDYVKVSLAGTDAQYAWVMAAYGIGSILGALVYSRLGEQARRVVIALVPTLLTVVLAAVTIAPSYALLISSWLLGGAGQVMIGVRANEYLATHSEPEEREAVYAAQFSFSHIIWLGTYPLAGFATTWFGFEGAAWLFAGLNIALVAARHVLVRHF